MLLSVIIPTYKRPGFLPRAVASALESSCDRVEVIVVPNGGDESWRTSLSIWANDSRVVISPVIGANSNAARNHGMSLASGDYIRFLDDDDFLYPETARNQLLDLIRSEADISFGQVSMTNADGAQLKLAYQLDTNDFAEAAIAPGHSTVPCALVMRRSITSLTTWDPSIRKNQDVYWAWELIGRQELRSVRYSQVVGAWVQHQAGPRVSQGHHRGAVAEEAASKLFDLLGHLEASGRLNARRKLAAANMLWDCIHSGIMFNPAYWYRISRVTRKLYRKSWPSTNVYRVTWVRLLNPVFIELALIPWRWGKAIITRNHHT